MSIKKNFIYSSILTTANYIFPLLTYPYVSRVLGVTSIGICNFVDSIIQYFILISTMGVATLGVREIAKAKGDRNELSSTYSSIFWINGIATLVALLALLLCAIAVPKLHQYYDMMILGGFKILFNFLLIEWLYKGLENFKYITIRSIVVKIGYVIAIFTLVHSPQDYALYYAISIGMIILNAIINVNYSRNFVTLRIKGLSIKPFIVPFITLGVYYILTSMYTSFNSVYLGFIGGETEVGYYATSLKVHSIIISLYCAFTGVMLPRMSAISKDNNIEAFKSLIYKSIDALFVFSFPIMVYFLVYAKECIYILSGPGYERAIPCFLISMPLLFVIGYEQVLVIQILMAMKKDKAVLTNSIIGALTGIALNVALVPILGCIGSSVSWFVSEFVVLISSQFFVAKYIGVYFPVVQTTRHVLFAIPISLLLLSLRFLALSMFSNLMIGFVIVVVYYYFIYINILKNSLAINTITLLKDKIFRK